MRTALARKTQYYTRSNRVGKRKSAPFFWQVGHVQSTRLSNKFERHFGSPCRLSIGIVAVSQHQTFLR